jgi:hypothetical protein
MTTIKRVDTIKFNRSYSQLWHSAWHNADRVCQFTGKCVVCQRRTYEFADGDNDPRGILGDHANHALVAEDYSMEGPDVPLCAICANEEYAYRWGMDKARRVWVWPTTNSDEEEE